MLEKDSCLKIFTDLKELLDVREYSIVSNYLKTLYNGTVSEMKSALIMTKAFKEHEDIKNSRKILLESYEKKINSKAI